MVAEFVAYTHNMYDDDAGTVLPEYHLQLWSDG